MTDKKQIIFWVTEDEREALLDAKGDMTWREFILTLAGIPCRSIPMGRPPRIRSLSEKGE